MENFIFCAVLKHRNQFNERREKLSNNLYWPLSCSKYWEDFVYRKRQVAFLIVRGYKGIWSSSLPPPPSRPVQDWDIRLYQYFRKFEGFLVQGGRVVCWHFQHKIKGGGFEDSRQIEDFTWQVIGCSPYPTEIQQRFGDHA